MSARPSGRQERWDVAVIGGGVVGLSAALELQARGRDVVVIDPVSSGSRSASFGNAGVISRGSLLAVAGPSVWPNLVRYALGRDAGVRIRWRSWPAFAAWLPRFLASSRADAWRRTALGLNPLVASAYDHHVRLAQRVGAERMIRRDGYLKLYRTAAGLAGAALERAILAEAGVRADVLGRDDVRQLEPHLADRYENALFFPETGSVDTPGALVDAYRLAFLERGGRWLAAKAMRIRPREDGAMVETEAGPVDADFAVLSAGAGSGRLLSPLGVRVPLAAERGYHLQLPLKAAARLGRPLHDVAGGFAAAPMAGGVRVLTGIELAGPDDPPDLRQLRCVLDRAKATLPVDDADPAGAWLGSRPSIADGRPVIGPACGLPRLMLAFGHGHIGFSTGPVTGRIVADLVTGATPPIPLEPFSPARFG